MQHLNNYNIEPDIGLKRKIDYYYTPYYNLEHTNKYMNFDEIDN